MYHWLYILALSILRLKVRFLRILRNRPVWPDRTVTILRMCIISNLSSSSIRFAKNACNLIHVVAN